MQDKKIKIRRFEKIFFFFLNLKIKIIDKLGFIRSLIYNQDLLLIDRNRVANFGTNCELLQFKYGKNVIADKTQLWSKFLFLDMKN